MKVKEDRRFYQRNRNRMIFSGKDYGYKYKAVKDGEVKMFRSRNELADFFGYNKDYLARVVKAGRDIWGWTITRWKWFEHIDEITGENAE